MLVSPADKPGDGVDGVRIDIRGSDHAGFVLRIAVSSPIAAVEEPRRPKGV